ncbi:MAG: RsmB/NOP family class I SAM-dependent RNA methyltransferase [Crenarchaeota archaeon]|nr:RsmB/NOP family class I SAM-dependent RNA methyltransferase [Thermoproteota archaeon]
MKSKDLYLLAHVDNEALVRPEGRPYAPRLSRYEGLIEIVRGIFIDRELYKHLLEHFSDSEIDRMFSSIRRPPARYYIRVNTRKIDPYDLYLKMSRRGLKVHVDEHIREALWFDVEGPNKIPSARKIVVADKYAAESVYVGANLYAPGVVKARGVKKGDEVTIIAPTGEEVAYGIAEMDEDEIRKHRRGLAVKVLVSRFRVPSLRELEEYKMGLIYDQSIAAQWVARIVNPSYNELIVDMNCAPGGKLTHVAQICNTCHVFGFDRSMPKIQDTLENINRLSLGQNCDVLVHDSRYLDVDFPRLIGEADKVILDPPCTSIGVRPKLIDVKTMRDVEVVSRYQEQFLRPAYKILRRGGRLVYSTCTVTILENERIIKLALRLGLEIEYVDVPYAERGRSGDWVDYFVARFLPHVHEFSPGFFIASLVKRR